MFGLSVPALHGVSAAEPAAQKAPAGHAVHEVAPVAFEKVPAAQTVHDVAPTARSCAVAMLTRKWGWHAERLGSAAPIGQDWAGGEHASRAVAARCHKLLRIKLTTLRIDVRRRRLWHGMAHVRRHRGICGRAGTEI